MVMKQGGRELSEEGGGNAWAWPVGGRGSHRRRHVAQKPP